MKGYTFFLGAAFLLTTTGAALAQNNLQSAKQRVEAITNAGTVQAGTSTPGPSPQIISLPRPRPSTGTVSGAVQQSTVNTGKISPEVIIARHSAADHGRPGRDHFLCC